MKTFIFVKNWRMNTEIKLELFRQIDRLPENLVMELKDVVQRFLQQRSEKINLTDADINGVEIQTLIENSTAFDFLKAEEEDIYSELSVSYRQ